MSAVSAVSAGLSIREFAKRDGCDEKLVRRAIEAGKLSKRPDDTLDPAMVGAGWRKTNRRAGASAAVAVLPGETAADAAVRIVSDGAGLLDIAQAERLKENYLGRLKQLEYDIKSGAVVPAEDVAKIVGEQLAAIRTRLLALPAEQAPRIHRSKTVAEVQDVLMTVVVHALEHLTYDGQRPAA